MTEKNWIVLRRSGLTLAPANRFEADKLEQIPSGEPLLWSYSHMRSPDHHRFFFALVKIIWDNLPDDEQAKYDGDQERFRKFLTARAGHCYTVDVQVRDMTGEMIEALKAVDPYLFFWPDPNPEAIGSPIRVVRAKSIAWDKMDQRAFKPFCDRVIDLIPEILGAAPDDVLARVEELVGVSYTSIGGNDGILNRQGSETDPATERGLA